MNKVVEEIVADTKNIDETLDQLMEKIKDDLNTPKKKRKKRSGQKKKDG